MAYKAKRKRWTDADKQAVWRASNGYCVGKCGRRFRLGEHGGPNGWTIDHIVPHAAGGAANGELNGQLMCRPCNQRKADRFRRGYLETSIGRMTRAIEGLQAGYASLPDSAIRAA